MSTSEPTSTDNVNQNNFNQSHDSNDHASIQTIMIETEKNLQILATIDNDVFDKLVNECQLSILKHLKQKLQQFKNEIIATIINDDNDKSDKSNNNNPGFVVHFDENVEYDDEKWDTSHNLLNNVIASTDGDSLSLLSAATAFTGITKLTNTTYTGVSSIAPPLSMNDPLIVIMGIGEYDGMPNLDGVSIDYDNMIDTFVNYWKYKIFYKLNNDKYIYTNNFNQIEKNYKLKWNGDEINQFIEESRQYLVKNKHNGLIFGISCHGDRDKILYDSECDEYDLDTVFSMYSPQASQLLETYQETKQESNHLFSVPKIFFLDMCRGNSKAQVTNIVANAQSKVVDANETKKQQLPSNENKNNNDNNKMKMESEEKKMEDVHVTMIEQQPISLHENEQQIVMKGISKEDAHILVGQMANFAKIYANIEGCSVADGSLHGGVFLRSVCNVFKDTKYVLNHKFTDMIFKIREYTKREATLNGSLFNFTQIVENEGTLEREVIFGSKNANILHHSILFDSQLSTLNETNINHDHLNGFNISDNSVAAKNQLHMTNVSLTDDIALLIETEQTRENRREILKKLERSNAYDDFDAFIDNGYIIIGKNYDSDKFDTVWDDYYVTMIVLGHEKNQVIYDRRMYFDNYLYYKNKQLLTLDDDPEELLPKCNAVSNESHSLYPTFNKKKNANVTVACRLCLTTIESDQVSFKCKQCQQSLCEHCCHSLIRNEAPERMNVSKYFTFKMTNASHTNKIAILVNIYGFCKDGININNDVILQLNERLLIEKGFIIINPWEAASINTVWKSYFLTLIELGKNKMVCDMKQFSCSDLLFDNGIIYRVLEDLPAAACNAVQNESHLLKRILVNNQNISTYNNLNCCIFCSSKIKIQSHCYHCKQCQHSLCHRCFHLMIFGETPLRLSTSQVMITQVAQKTKESIEIVLKNTIKAPSTLECKIEAETTDGTQVLKDSHSIDLSNVHVGTSAEFEILLNIDDIEDEFKESQLNYSTKLILIDTKNQIQSLLHPTVKNIPIWTRTGFDYNCTFTTLNGVGRFGPTNMDEYQGHCHFNDTQLVIAKINVATLKQKQGLLSFVKRGGGKGKKQQPMNNGVTSMQLWTIPKTGVYKIVCYGAKGGDSKYNRNLLFGGKGAQVGTAFRLFENDIIQIVCGQRGQDYIDKLNSGDSGGGGGGGGGGSFFILHKIGNKNPNYNYQENRIVNIPLVIAAGGNGACNARYYKVNGIDGLCDVSDSRNDYNRYKTNGRAGRGGSFRNDFGIFQSCKYDDENDYNKCNPMSLLDGAIGGKRFKDGWGCDGGFGGGGGSECESGGGGGYIGGLVPRRDPDNENSNKYSSYGALSFICKNDNNIENVDVFYGGMISGANNSDGKIEVTFLG